MKLVEDICEKVVLTPINVVTLLSPINRKYKIFTSYSYIKKKKRAAADTGDSFFSSKWHR